MDPVLVGGFFLVSLAIEVTPGPNMAYLALVGLSRGRADGLMAVAGVALGLLLLGGLVGVGLGGLILDNRAVYEALRWGGAAYLCYLAYDAWREGNRPLTEGPEALARWRYFQRGFLTNLLNPKAALFYVAVLPGFVDARQPALGQMTVLVAVYVLAATLVHAALVLAAATLAPLLQRPEWRRRTALGSALMLVAVAAWLLLRTG